MNIPKKERLLELAAIIEKQPWCRRITETGFTMERFVHECGTPACIAGWAAAQLVPNSNLRWLVMEGDVPWLAVEWLCDEKIEGRPLPPWSEQLFMPSGDWRLISPSMAAKTLRHLAETGNVVWNIKR